jgi:hypothetical protein
MNAPFQRSLAKEDHAAEAFGFERTEIPLKMSVQVRALNTKGML